jgi:hypothetical protein
METKDAAPAERRVAVENVNSDSETAPAGRRCEGGDAWGTERRSLALLAEGKKFTRERSDARVCSYPMAAQIGDRRAIVAIKQCCLGLYPDKRGAKDFSDEAATQFVRAHVICAGSLFACAGASFGIFA